MTVIRNNESNDGFGFILLEISEWNTDLSRNFQYSDGETKAL